MTSKKMYYVLLGTLVFLVLLLIGSANIATGIIAKRSGALSVLKTQKQVLENEQHELSTDKIELAKYAGLNTIAETVVPQDKNQAEAVREISNLANASGIGVLSSITFPASTLGIITPANSKSLTQVTPVKNIPGVDELPITITQNTSSYVSYSSFITFLSALEQNRRTSQVSSINIQPDPKDLSLVSFTLIINEYVRP